MKPDSTEALRALLAVIDHGGFSAAARRLSVSVSHVSRLVSDLEERLGVRLLQRTTRSVTPTEAGRTLHVRARDLVAALDELTTEVANQSTELSGSIRVAAGGAYGERFVAPALTRFALEHPGVRIELLMSDRRIDLVSDGVDFAVRHGVLSDSSLIARRVGSRRMRLAAAPDYLAGAPPLESFDDLGRHSCLASPDIPWRLRALDGERLFRPSHGRFVSNNGPALVDAALAGLGVIWLADFYVRDAIADGRLVRVLPNTEIEAIATWIVQPTRHHVPRRVQALMDYLLDVLDG